MKMNFKGKFKLRHWRDGEIIREIMFPNSVVNEGINAIFDVMFNGGAQSGSWYIGLIDENAYGGITPSDTMSSRSWSEWINYTEGTRQQWVSDPSINENIKNPVGTLAVFTMNATGTLKGSFLTNDNVKAGTTGLLWSAATFEEGDIEVTASDVLEVQYVLGGSSG